MFLSFKTSLLRTLFTPDLPDMQGSSPSQLGQPACPGSPPQSVWDTAGQRTSLETESAVPGSRSQAESCSSRHSPAGCRRLYVYLVNSLILLPLPLVSQLVLQAQPTTKDYIRAEHKLHSLSKLVISQVIIPQSHVFLAYLYSAGTQRGNLHPAG